jgi:hypothetical protein
LGGDEEEEQHTPLARLCPCAIKPICHALSLFRF